MERASPGRGAGAGECGQARGGVAGRRGSPRQRHAVRVRLRPWPRTKKAAISSKTPSPAFDAHIAAYWRETARIRRLLHCSPDPDAHVRAWRQSLHDAHVRAWLGTPEALLATVERLEREDADALADDLAAALDANPDVIRAKLRTLLNDLYQLNDESNDWWNETQRAEAEAETVAAFGEKLEDLSLDVKRSQQNRKRQAEIEARRVELRRPHPRRSGCGDGGGTEALARAEARYRRLVDEETRGPRSRARVSRSAFGGSTGPQRALRFPGQRPVVDRSHLLPERRL